MAIAHVVVGAYHPVSNEHSSEEAQELGNGHQCERISSGVLRSDVRVQRCSDENTTREEQNNGHDATEAGEVVAGIRFASSQTAEDGQESSNTDGDQCLREENVR